jgi:hypothetical protein
VAAAALRQQPQQLQQQAVLRCRLEARLWTAPQALWTLLLRWQPAFRLQVAAQVLGFPPLEQQRLAMALLAR